LIFKNNVDTADILEEIFKKKQNIVNEITFTLIFENDFETSNILEEIFEIRIIEFKPDDEFHIGN
jgi:hypothetical protein